MPDKQDSNVVGLRIAEETTYKVLPGTPEWIAYEPNSYADFGGQITNQARNPINESRQRQKGVTTDLDASGGFNQDWVQNKLRDILQGFMFANWRPQATELVTAVDGTTEDYDVASTTGFVVNHLLFAENHTNAENNGLKVIDAIVADTSIGVVFDLVAEASPPATAKVTIVGHQGADDDIDVTAPAGGNLGFLTSTALDFTTLGLVPGAWIFIGGDIADNQFAAANNNGFHRVFSIAATKLEIDRGLALTTEVSAGAKNVRIFVGETLKNEATPALIIDRSYQLERTLGDDGGGTQSEYEIGARASQLQWNVSGQDKITVDLSFMAADEEVRTGATGVKSGNRPALAAEEAFNTSSDFTRLKLTRDSDGSALFAFVTEFTLTVDNSLSPNKAVSVLGAFDISKGQFVVTGSITAYFADTTAKTALRNNEDVSFDFAVAKNNAGWVVDVPLITLGDARLNVEQDGPITLPLTLDAGKDTTFDHTLLLNNFIYLPNAAQ